MSLRKILLLVFSGIAVVIFVMAAMLWNAVRQRDAWKSGPGETLVFEIEGGRVNSTTMLPLVGERLGNTRAIVKEDGPTRISVWIPLGDAQRQAASELKSAMSDLARTVPTRAAVEAVLRLSGVDQKAALETIAPAGSAAQKFLDDFKAATEENEKAQKQIATFALGAAAEELRRQAFDSNKAMQAAWAGLSESFIDTFKIGDLLTRADDGELAARMERDGLAAAFPLQAGHIHAVVAAREKWHAAGGGLHPDADDIEKLLQSRGEVEFRIAVMPDEVNFPVGQEYLDAVQSLKDSGPLARVPVNGSQARWFEIPMNKLDNFHYSTISEPWSGRKYVLCYDDTFHTLIHSDPARKPWTLHTMAPYADPTLRSALPFELDAVGAMYLGQITSDNIRHPLCILVDDQAMSAPNVMSRITNAGVITMGIPAASHSTAAIRKEADALYAVLHGDPFPAPLHRIK